MVIQLKGGPIDTEVLWSFALKLSIRDGVQTKDFDRDIPAIDELVLDLAAVLKKLQVHKKAPWIASDCTRRFPDLPELGGICPYCGGEVKRALTRSDAQTAVAGERERSLGECKEEIGRQTADGVVSRWKVGHAFLQIQRGKLHEADTSVKEKHFSKWCALSYPFYSEHQVERMLGFARAFTLEQVESCKKLGMEGWDRIRQGLLAVQSGEEPNKKDVVLKLILSEMEQVEKPTTSKAAQITERVTQQAVEAGKKKAEEEALAKSSAAAVSHAADKPKRGRPKKDPALKPPKKSPGRPRKDATPAAPTKDAPKKGRDVVLPPKKIQGTFELFPTMEVCYLNPKSGLPVRKPAGKILGKWVEVILGKQAIRLTLLPDLVRVEVVPARR